MKKLFLIAALIAYVFSDDCEKCQNACKNKYQGLLQAAKRRACIADCVFEAC